MLIHRSLVCLVISDDQIVEPVVHVCGSLDSLSLNILVWALVSISSERTNRVAWGNAGASCWRPKGCPIILRSAGTYRRVAGRDRTGLATSLCYTCTTLSPACIHVCHSSSPSSLFSPCFGELHRHTVLSQPRNAPSISSLSSCPRPLEELELLFFTLVMHCSLTIITHLER